jgi:hypothetical protein
MKLGMNPFKIEETSTRKPQPYATATIAIIVFRKKKMVERAGFEPAYAYAGRFTVCCL